MQPNPARQIRATADQDKAILQAREWMQESARAVVVDTETTGLDGEVWEFAAVQVVDGLPVLAWMANANGSEWSEKAREMHDHRLEEIAQCPDVELFEAPTFHTLKNRVVLAYNAPFDRRALERTLGGIDTLPEFGCVAEMYAPFGLQWSESRQAWKFISLVDACANEQIDVQHAHSAFWDARATVALVQSVAQKLTSAEREARDEETAAQVYEE